MNCWKYTFLSPTFLKWIGIPQIQCTRIPVCIHFKVGLYETCWKSVPTPPPPPLQLYFEDQLKRLNDLYYFALISFLCFCSINHVKFVLITCREKLQCVTNSLERPPNFIPALYIHFQSGLLYRYWPRRSWNIMFRWTAKSYIFPRGYIFPKRASLRENIIMRENITILAVHRNVIFHPSRSISGILDGQNEWFHQNLMVFYDYHKVR